MLLKEFCSEIFAIIAGVACWSWLFGIKVVCPNCQSGFYFKAKTVCSNCGFDLAGSNGFESASQAFHSRSESPTGPETAGKTPPAEK